MISENNKRDSTTKMCMHKLLSAVGFPLYTLLVKRTENITNTQIYWPIRDLFWCMCERARKRDRDGKCNA